MCSFLWKCVLPVEIVFTIMITKRASPKPCHAWHAVLGGEKLALHICNWQNMSQSCYKMQESSKGCKYNSTLSDHYSRDLCYSHLLTNGRTCRKHCCLILRTLQFEYPHSWNVRTDFFDAWNVTRSILTETRKHNLWAREADYRSRRRSRSTEELGDSKLGGEKLIFWW